MRRARPIVLALAMLVLGCHHAQTVESARSRHAVQFGCVASDVQVEEIRYNGGQNSGTFAATGCGVRQMYYCDSSQCVADGAPVRLAGTGGGEAPAGGGCEPPCSPGYQCVETTCRALCNPPCSPGYECAQDRTCQPE